MNYPKRNPFQGVAKRFRALPVQHQATFTGEEVRKIIQGFRSSRYYSHYTDYVFFKFNVGVRPGEAAALKWEHISSDFETVYIGYSYSRGNTGSTKTKKARTEPLNPAASRMLKTRFDRLQPQLNDLVFTTPNGLPIDDKNFNRRAWKTVLADVEVRYRRPYTTRKTAGNQAIANGANHDERKELMSMLVRDYGALVISGTGTRSSA
jgi:integrase